jgi:hypothetical protein
VPLLVVKGAFGVASRFAPRTLDNEPLTAPTGRIKGRLRLPFLLSAPPPKRHSRAGKVSLENVEQMFAFALNNRPELSDPSATMKA